MINMNRSRLQYVNIVDDMDGITHVYRLLPWFGEDYGPGSKSCTEVSS